MELTCFDCLSWEEGLCLKKRKFKDEDHRICANYTDKVSGRAISIRTFGTDGEIVCSGTSGSN